MRSRLAGALALVALAWAAACTDEMAASPDPGVDGGGESDGPADARRPRADTGPAFCEPQDARAAVMPAAYVDRENPFAGDTAAVTAGRATFMKRCTSCHGEDARGDGPEAPVRPPPANLTATRRSDAYLFWRISEGGVDLPFCTAMPAFMNFLDEDVRWELVSFVQSIAPPLPDAGADGGN